MDYVRRPEFKVIIEHGVGKLEPLPFSGVGKETPTLLGSLERANV
jgi:hypothetical protein